MKCFYSTVLISKVHVDTSVCDFWVRIQLQRPALCIIHDVTIIATIKRPSLFINLDVTISTNNLRRHLIEFNQLNRILVFFFFNLISQILVRISIVRLLFQHPPLRSVILIRTKGNTKRFARHDHLITERFIVLYIVIFFSE